MRQVACPVLRRGSDLLVFRHPLAGVQLVKGGVQTNETPSDAALRELREESGISATLAGPAVTTEIIQPDQKWWLIPVHAPNLPDGWTHHCTDDGGHDFRFFWHPQGKPLIDADPRYDSTRRLIAAMP